MSDYIHFDIQAEIIKRLPIKSLIQFRSVSNPWKSLIDSSQFIAEYQRKAPLQQHLHVRKDLFQHDYVSFLDNDTFPHQNVSLTLPKSVLKIKIPRILGSSQGLFCLSDIHETAIIWNPTLRKSVDVVMPKAFDGHFYYNVLGFGVCPRTLDPMLIIIPDENGWPFLENFTTWVVEVFRLSLGVWKSLCLDLPTWYIASRCSQVVIDKFIYWHAFGRMSGYNVIIYFDMISEEFTEISLPDRLSLRGIRNDDTDMGLDICKLKESLVVLQFDETDSCSDFDVWMMNNGDQKSFENIYTIKSNIPEALTTNVLEFNRKGEVIIVVEMTKELDEEKEDELFVYEPTSQHVNHLGISAKRYSFFVRSYTGTLLLLDY